MFCGFKIAKSKPTDTEAARTETSPWPYLTPGCQGVIDVSEQGRKVRKL